MNWLVIILLFIVVPIVGTWIVNYFWDLKKDKHDLKGQTLVENFKVIVDALNNHAFEGRGRIISIDKSNFYIYEDKQNQILLFEYSTGVLTIIWKYKYFHQEVVHKKFIPKALNLSNTEQLKVANELIVEMSYIIDNHKKSVQSAAGF